MDNDIRRRLKDVLMFKRVTVNSISHGTAEQRRLNRQINEDATITFETISSIIENFPDLDANWLLTGKGAMLKDGINTHINGKGNSVRNFSNVNVANNSSGRITVGENNSVPGNDNQKNEIEILQQTNNFLKK